MSAASPYGKRKHLMQEHTKDNYVGMHRVTYRKNPPRFAFPVYLYCGIQSWHLLIKCVLQNNLEIVHLSGSSPHDHMKIINFPFKKTWLTITTKLLDEFRRNNTYFCYGRHVAARQFHEVYRDKPPVNNEYAVSICLCLCHCHLQYPCHEQCLCHYN